MTFQAWAVLNPASCKCKRDVFPCFFVFFQHYPRLQYANLSESDNIPCLPCSWCTHCGPVDASAKAVGQIRDQQPRRNQPFTSLTCKCIQQFTINRNKHVPFCPFGFVIGDPIHALQMQTNDSTANHRINMTAINRHVQWSHCKMLIEKNHCQNHVIWYRVHSKTFPLWKIDEKQKMRVSMVFSIPNDQKGTLQSLQKKYYGSKSFAGTLNQFKSQPYAGLLDTPCLTLSIW